MQDGLLTFFYVAGIIQNGVKLPVDLTFRPELNHRFFYHTIETDQFIPETGKIIERREIESVEKISSTNKTTFYVTNINVKIKPRDSSKSEKYLKRPHFDRLEQIELPGDFRSRMFPFGYKWMLLPTSESLMTPDHKFYEGQKWAVKMTGGNFEIHYELKKIDHEKHTAYVDGYKGICRHDSEGTKRWNASWAVDTRSGIIKRFELILNHEYQPPKKTIHTKIVKVLTREADDQMIFDYEIADIEEL